MLKKKKQITTINSVLNQIFIPVKYYFLSNISNIKKTIKLKYHSYKRHKVNIKFCLISENMSRPIFFKSCYI